MHEYRFHFYNEAGKFQRVEAINAPNDEAALERARIRNHPYRVSILCGSRAVGTLNPQGG